MLIPATVYHIYNRANGSESLFREDENYGFFLDKYFRYINPVAETFAFVLMPNHFHFMIRTRGTAQVAQNLNVVGIQDDNKIFTGQFSRLFNAYAKAFNKKYKRNGSLFQRPFKYKEVNNNAYFTSLILYIHNNPVKHGFVTNVYDWSYSSIHQLSKNESEKLNNREIVDWFGDIIQFKKAHENIGDIKSLFD